MRGRGDRSRPAAGNVKPVTSSGTDGTLDAFHPAVREWFRRRFAAPSRAQELGWPVIAGALKPPGHDVLLCAPTGSGKTLAAFMWAIDRLITQAAAGPLADEVAVLYVSPLKALANDIRLNLEEPLIGVREVAGEMGLELAPVRAGLRTGDTPVAERAAMLRRPPQILVTTPESLFILLTSPRFRTKLRAVRYVIVDELHAVAGDKRGAHLALTLERLERMVRRAGAPRPVRIGLSATLNPIAALAAFLAGAEVAADGTRTLRPVRIVRADDVPRALDLKVIAPGPDLGALATHQHWDAMYDAIAELIRAHRTTLVFTLSRRWAERVALALQKRVGAGAVMAHHGSLARAERLVAEQRLKRGDLKAIVATASLELGIDVGAVDLVCQIDSPKSISAAIQRVGRSGHSLGATPKGRLFALTVDDLLECAAAVRAIRAGHLDEVEVPLGCLDVAAQQIVAITAEEEDIAEHDLLALLRSACNYGALGAGELRTLLEQMAAPLADRIQGAAPKIFYDRAARRVRPRRGARLAAITSGGTIPESGNYDVVIASAGRKIGDVEEDFAQESARGDVFSLGSMPWKILGISKNRLMVEPAPGMAPTLPFWQTEAAGRSPALSAEVSELRERVAAMLVAGGRRVASNGAGDGAAKERAANSAAKWLADECAMDEGAAAQVVAWIARGLDALGVVPGPRSIVVERFFDGLGGTQIVIHSPFGMRVNRGLGLALRKRLCQSFDFEIQASAIDDAVLLALNSRHSFALEQVMAMLPARSARATLVQALLDAPMFEVRFRHVATRALAVMRAMGGRRVPAWIQRLRTQDLITALFPRRNACFENRPPVIEIPAHFVVGETVRECLEESTDATRMVALLEGFESGAVRAVYVDNVAPSVFAQRILLAWDYSFLDDGERANRRSRSVTMNREMAAEVLREDDLSALLSADAAARVAAELGGSLPGSRPRTGDELYELIHAHGALAVAAIARPAGAQADALAGRLEREGRIVRARVAPAMPEVYIAAEDLALYAVAYPDARIAQSLIPFAQGAQAPDSSGARAPDLDNAPAPDADAARHEIVRRALATSIPATAREFAARLELPEAVVERILAALEGQGTVFRGYFTTPRPPAAANMHDVAQGSGAHASEAHENRGAAAATAEQWCDRYVLERIHRQTLARLRAEIEPADDRDFAAFRLRWFNVGAGLAANRESVELIVEQLAGLAFTPDFWERAILPARIPGYRPEDLDLLCLSGDLRWIASPESVAGANATAEFPGRVAFMPRRARLAAGPAPAADQDPAAHAVHGALRTRGAQYLDEIAERAGLSERDTLAALWRLAAAGLASNDSFAPLRLLASDHDASRAVTSATGARPANRHDAALRARLKSSLSGRWSALGAEYAAAASGSADRTAQAAAVSSSDTVGFDETRERALALLARNGVLTREMLALESQPIAWSGLVFALRRMEYGGTIRRGYFVRALSGEQYALPEALEMLRAGRMRNGGGERAVAISAADPANPHGALLPACGVAREPGNLLVMRGGCMILGLVGRALVGGTALDDASFAAALGALIALRPKLYIETIAERPALESDRVVAMAAMGFHSDGRALVYDGLPGPAPARAISARQTTMPS